MGPKGISLAEGVGKARALRSQVSMLGAQHRYPTRLMQVLAKLSVEMTVEGRAQIASCYP